MNTKYDRDKRSNIEELSSSEREGANGDKFTDSTLFKEIDIQPFNQVGFRNNRFLFDRTLDCSFFTGVGENNENIEIQNPITQLSFDYIDPKGINKFNTKPEPQSDTPPLYATYTKPGHILIADENAPNNTGFKHFPSFENDVKPELGGKNTNTLVALGKLNLLDFPRFDSAKQDFLVNLIQNGFLKFDSEGKDPGVVDKTELSQFVKRVRTGVAVSEGNRGSDFLQSFFVFDFENNFVSGDRVRKAYLNIFITSHFGERQVDYFSMPHLSSLEGPLRINARKFDIVKVKKAITRNYAEGNVADSRFFFGPNKETEEFDSFYCTGNDDVDLTVSSRFVVDSPMKEGFNLKIDVTNILQDAIDNESGVFRAVLRPVLKTYERGFVTQTIDTGVGNHWFEFDRETNPPSISFQIDPSENSTPERLSRLRRGLL